MSELIVSESSTITVNGASRPLAAPTTVRALLAELGRDPEQPGVAVALDDRVVRRALWAETVVEPGARVEVITASQGG